MSEPRETLLARTFVILADSLVDDYDVLDLLTTLVEHATELFDASAAGITLGPDAQHLEVLVATSEQSRAAEHVELRTGQGPGVDAVVSGRVVSVATLREMSERWPVFAAEVEPSGFASMHAIPLRLRGETIGSFNLFREHEGTLTEADAIAAQALADVATIGVLQERLARDSDIVQQQLQHALDSRVIVEQAKGVLAEKHGMDMDDAYGLLRQRARSTQTRLTAVAAGVVDGTIAIPT